MSVKQAVRNPRSYAGRLVHMYRSLLFDPATFYDEYVKRPGIGREAALVAVVGAIGTVGAYYAITQLEAGFATGMLATGPSLGDETRLVLYQRAVNPLAGAFVLWAGFAGSTYAISWLYSDRGGIFRLLKNTAWGLVPVAFANLLNAGAWVATAYLNRQRYADAIPTQVESRTMFPQETAAFVWGFLAEEPAVVATTALSVLFVAWSGYIIAHGLARMRDVELGEAYRVTAVPVVAYVAWAANQLLGVL